MSVKENVSDEINALKREGELPLEDLLSDYLEKRDMILSPEPSEGDHSDGDFNASGKDTSDDEETIQEQEKAEGKVDYGKELQDLEVSEKVLPSCAESEITFVVSTRIYF